MEYSLFKNHGNASGLRKVVRSPIILFTILLAFTEKEGRIGKMDEGHPHIA